jgi:toxin ParE1/3/4
MKLPEFSPRAAADLDEILAFIARDKPLAAEKFVIRLKDKCHLLAEFPEMGRRRDDLSPGLRVFVVGNYANYYQSSDGRIRVERVLHAARDVDALFD